SNLVGELERQPGLSDTARPAETYRPDSVENASKIRKVTLPANESIRLSRKVARCKIRRHWSSGCGINSVYYCIKFRRLAWGEAKSGPPAPDLITHAVTCA